MEQSTRVKSAILQPLLLAPACVDVNLVSKVIPWPRAAEPSVVSIGLNSEFFQEIINFSKQKKITPIFIFFSIFRLLIFFSLGNGALTRGKSVILRTWMLAPTCVNVNLAIKARQVPKDANPFVVRKSKIQKKLKTRGCNPKKVWNFRLRTRTSTRGLGSEKSEGQRVRSGGVKGGEGCKPVCGT